MQLEFINADEIARGLSPLNPAGAAIAASRIMLQRMILMIEGGKSFSFETTLAGLAYFNIIKRAKEKGYIITLLFI